MGSPDIKKIRLLLLTPTLKCGGSEKFVSVLCNNIDSEKFAVTLAVLNNADPFYTIRNKAISIVDLKVKHVRRSGFKIRKIVKREEPDVIFSTSNHLNIYLAIFRRFFFKKARLIARESSLISLNKSRVRFPFFYDKLVKIYYKRFDCILCQSAYMQLDLIHHYNITAGKTVVIHNAVEVVSESMKAGRVADKACKFITVARLSEEKGIERLIHAVGLLSPPFRFYIIGEGPMRGRLEQLAHSLQLGEKLIFCGETKEPFAGMEDADLFLSGSYYEGFPNALLEAQALGIPAVAFDVPGGIGEIIRQGENGLLVEDNDLIGFAAAIKEALSRAFNRREIIENTQKRFSVQAMIQKMEQLLTEL